MTEPSPLRDVGPFTDSAQAATQYAAQMHGIPDDVVLEQGPLMVILEACLLVGLNITDHEKTTLAGDLTDETSVIMAGLIIRASRTAHLHTADA